MGREWGGEKGGRQRAKWRARATPPSGQPWLGRKGERVFEGREGEDQHWEQEEEVRDWLGEWPGGCWSRWEERVEKEGLLVGQHGEPHGAALGAASPPRAQTQKSRHAETDP